MFLHPLGATRMRWCNSALVGRPILTSAIPFLKIIFTALYFIPFQLFCDTDLSDADLVLLCNVLQSIFVFMWVSYEPLTYNRTYSYPSWALALGMCMAFASMACVPLYIAGRFLFATGTIKQVNVACALLKQLLWNTIGRLELVAGADC